ncbi:MULTISPECIES: hypothetical protein [unclassified Variovorax]|uniref:hypothetical protein n=1 Tax=unclassified Variovorax TaxID=663243 RepID=UPI0032E66AB1
MHSGLSVAAQGLPLGLCAIGFWSRQKFKGTSALKRKTNPTCVPIEEKERVTWLLNLRQSSALIDEPETERCVHMGDSEGDIYELFCLADELASWCKPASIDRLATANKRSLRKWLRFAC